MNLLGKIGLSVDLGKVHSQLVLHARGSNLQHPCGRVQLALNGGNSWHCLLVTTRMYLINIVTTDSHPKQQWMSLQITLAEEHVCGQAASASGTAKSRLW